MDSKQLALKISDLIFSKKGYDVTILNLSKLASFADYFVICSADSTTQVKAISDEVDKKLRDEGIRVWHREGYNALSWVLLDFVDVVVHIFKKDAREFYNLEKLWGDAPVVNVTDSAAKTDIKAKAPAGVKKIKKKPVVKKTTQKDSAKKSGTKKNK